MIKILNLIKLLFISSLLIHSYKSEDVKDLIKKVITNIVKAIPQYKEELKSHQSGSVVVSQIVQNGFTQFQQQADLQLYNGVSDDNLDNFLKYVRSMIQLPESYEKYFIENLSLILYSDFNEIVIYKVLFSVNTGGDCKYICVMGQRNENGSTDWLVGDIKSQFTLAPDLLVIEKTKSSLWGLVKTQRTEVIPVPKSLNEEQLNILFKFFEICVFERFAELLHIDVNSMSLKFLS